MNITNAKTIAPILITKTRSFWLGIVPASLTLVDVIAGSVSNGTSEPIAGAIAALTGPVFGISADDVHRFMLAIAPQCALIIAHQRSGIARPYTVTPSRERNLVQTIEDGKMAFAVGKAFAERQIQRGSHSHTPFRPSPPPFKK